MAGVSKAASKLLPAAKGISRDWWRNVALLAKRTRRTVRKPAAGIVTRTDKTTQIARRLERYLQSQNRVLGRR